MNQVKQLSVLKVFIKTIDFLKTVALFLLLLLGFPAQAQIKIYVSTDLEGASGVYNFTQTREKGSPENIQACEYFMDDLAALIHGLRDGGATEIVVVDGHGSQAMIPHMMVPGAKYVTGKPKTIREGWELDSTYNALVMFGYHAMMGTPDGVLCHTQNSRRENKYWYNGVESGELVQVTHRAGLVGVPLIMVTGDVATCREANHFFGNEIITVATKEGISREAAILYPFEENRRAIYEGAKKAISVISNCQPYTLELPVKCRLEQLDPGADDPKKVVVKEWISVDGKNLLSPQI